MSTRRSRTRGTAAVVASLPVALVPACSGVGGEGERCKLTGGIETGGYSCDDGLVCYDVANETPTCEKPNTHTLGEPCGGDDDCTVGLWCDDKACAKPLGANDSCPNGTGCGAGLQCVKSGSTPTCAPVDAGGAD
jgi:hypothetical protein